MQDTVLIQYMCILRMIVYRYSRLTEPRGMCHWCSAFFGCFQPLNGIALSPCVCGSCCIHLYLYIRTLLWWEEKTDTSLDHFIADSSHVLLRLWYCIFLLHCQSSVWTVWWISAGPSQLFQSCVLLFVRICCDCSSLCHCWNWFRLPLILVVDFAHWKVITAKPLAHD